MAYDALAFLEALDLSEIDVLGYSMGGFVAQELTLIRPRLVRRLLLAGTGPQGGPELHGYRDEVYGNATADEPGADDLLALFFERSPTSIAKGQEFIQRIFARTERRDVATSLDTRDRQLDAVTSWGIPDASRLDRLAGITQPVLAANGDNDRMVPAINTLLLAERLPNAELKIYPDAVTASSSSTRPSSRTSSTPSSPSPCTTQAASIDADTHPSRSITCRQRHPAFTQPRPTPRSDPSGSTCPKPSSSTSVDASPRRGGPARSSSKIARRACSRRRPESSPATGRPSTIGAPARRS